MKNLIINALGRTQGWSMIKSLGLNISPGSKADMTYDRQAAEWQTEGICGIAQEKEKNCFSREWTMLIIWCCANSWPWISLGWKFWKKKRFQTIRSDFWKNLPIADAEEKLQLFSRWRYSHIRKIIKEVLAGLLSSPNFFSYTRCPWSLLQFCDLSLNFQ